jgi:tRNA(Ile)-lysidine synthase
VRAFLRAVKGDLRGFTFGDVEAVRLLAERKKAALSGNLLFGREKGLISVRQRATPATRYGHEWNGKEDLSIPEIGLSFSAKAVNKGKTALPPYNDDLRALLDAGKMEFPLLARSRKEGDRYRPLGAPGRKKLKEIMRAKGIPAEERNCLPVFVSSGRLSAPGLPVAEDYKVSPATQVVLSSPNTPKVISLQMSKTRSAQSWWL